MTTTAPATNAPNPLLLCNNCDSAPMAPGQQDPSTAGLCAECLADPRCDRGPGNSPEPTLPPCDCCGYPLRQLGQQSGVRYAICTGCSQTFTFQLWADDEDDDDPDPDAEDHGPGCAGPYNCTCPEPEGLLPEPAEVLLAELRAIAAEPQFRRLLADAQ